MMETADRFYRIEEDIARLAQHGYWALPVRKGEKRPFFSWKAYKDQAKAGVPPTEEDVQKILEEARTVRSDYIEGLGIIVPQGQVHLDADAPGAAEVLEKLVNLAETPSWTSERGPHALVAAPWPPGAETLKLPGGIEAKGPGTFAVIPPSGGRRWLTPIGDRPPVVVSLPPAVVTLIPQGELEPGEPMGFAGRWLRNPVPIPEGGGQPPEGWEGYWPLGRDDAMYRVACYLRECEHDPQAVLGMLRSFNQAWCRPPLEDRQVAEKVRSAFQRESPGILEMGGMSDCETPIPPGGMTVPHVSHASPVNTNHYVQRTHIPTPTPTPTPIPTQAFGPAHLPVNVFAAPPRLPESVVPGLLYHDHRGTLIFADAGTGKSIQVLHLALAALRTEAFRGVLLLSDEHEQFSARAWEIGQRWPSYRQFDILVATRRSSHLWVPNPGQARWEQFAEVADRIGREYPGYLIIVDPLEDYAGPVVAKYGLAIRDRLTVFSIVLFEHGCVVIWVHHTNNLGSLKGSRSEIEGRMSVIAQTTGVEKVDGLLLRSELVVKMDRYGEGAGRSMRLEITGDGVQIVSGEASGGDSFLENLHRFFWEHRTAGPFPTGAAALEAHLDENGLLDAFKKLIGRPFSGQAKKDMKWWSRIRNELMQRGWIAKAQGRYSWRSHHDGKPQYCNQFVPKPVLEPVLGVSEPDQPWWNK